MKYLDNQHLRELALPRVGLREESFRRYEDLIAKASGVPSLEVNLMEFPGRVRKATVFIARFNDARLAYETFHYKSTKIPPGFNVRALKAIELVDGRVLIDNLAFTAMAKYSLDCSNHPAMLSLIDRLLKNDSALASEIYVKLTNDDDWKWLVGEKARLDALAKADPSNPFGEEPNLVFDRLDGMVKFYGPSKD